MKTAMIAIGLLAAGLVGGLAGGILFPPETVETKPENGPSKVESRVADLEDAVARLTDEVRLLRTASPSPVVDERPLSAAEPVAAEVPAGQPEETEAVPEDQLRLKILDVVEEKEKQDREAREQRRREMAVQFESRMLDRLAEELGLNAYQQEELGRILAARRMKMEEIRQRFFPEGIPRGGERNPDQFALLREEMEKVREESNTQVQAVLTPEQYETFQQQDRGPGRGGPGRGGFGGGRPGR
jgi:hypothetical protein